LLPEEIRLAYDGLELPVTLGQCLYERSSRQADSTPRDHSVSRDLSVFRSVEHVPAGFGPSVAAIGNFDGVHLGHREILSAVVDEARALGVRAVAITFDPHPEQFLRPPRPHNC